MIAGGSHGVNALLERALSDLDQSTNDLLDADTEDIGAVCDALERRADAITKMAFLMEENLGRSEATLKRLSSALSRGDAAARRALDMKQDASVEWTRLNQILRGYTNGSRRHTATDVSV
jgi:hypothetical protein